MRKIAESDYRHYIAWAGKNTANKVYPSSIAEGFQTGDIYVNESVNVESVFFWHYCGFGYISGKATEAFLNDIYAEMMSGSGRRLVLITSDEDVASFFRGRDVTMDLRAEYSYLQKGTAAYFDTDRFRIQQIDEGNIAGIEGRIVPSFAWKSPESFLANGFGYIVLERDKICAAAFSAAVSSGEIDIGVETHEEYRRMGLAAALAGTMCEHIVRVGKRPVWAHSVSNVGSMNTALKCGFVREKLNTVIRR